MIENIYEGQKLPVISRMFLEFYFRKFVDF